MEGVYQEVPNDIRIDYISNSAGWNMKAMHYHSAYEIYILEKGERSYIINDTFVELSAGDVALIKPFELHSTDGGIYSRYLLYFTENYLNRFFTKEAKDTLLEFFSCKKLSLSVENFEKIKSLLSALRSNYDDFIVFSRILHLLLDVSKKSSSPVVSNKNKLISRIIEYIANNYLEIENLDKIADHFFITKHYLCRLFKKETGVSVITYINTHKIQAACEKLEFTRINIEQIALECGFNSSMYFCKLFKKTIGMKPGEYRKSKQE